MKNLICVIINLLCALSFIQIQAQEKVNIRGQILDKSNKEDIEQASVRIISQRDSSFVTGTSSDLDGKFSVSVNPGKYILSVSYLGYTTNYIDVNTTKGSVSLGDIFLSDDGVLLKEAVVTAKAVEIAVKGDTIEYNADSYKVQENAVVEDLLKKMPGAEVDSEGKITINGKEIKKILVDGKEFFSTDPKVASKNLPAQMVDKLQVLDKKSDMSQMTGFDDGDEETVINLTVKKGMKEGLFGNATAGVGNKDRYGIKGMANYMKNDNQFTLIAGSNNTNNTGFTDDASSNFRRSGGMNFGGNNGITKSTNGGFNFALKTSEKLKWGGNVRLGDTSNDVKTTSYKERYSVGSSNQNQYSNNIGYGKNESTNYGADLRFEWTPDASTKIIFSPNMQFGKNTNNQSDNQLTTYENPNDTVNWGASHSYSKGNSHSLSGTLDISRELNKKGRVLSFSFSGGLSNQDSDGTNWSQMNYREISSKVDSVALIDQIYDQKNKSNNWRAFASYVEPIGHNNFLQLNYSIQRNHTQSDRNTYLNDGSNSYTVTDSINTKNLENNFINQEVALNFKSVREKYNYTVGMAMQPSRSKSTTSTPQESKSLDNNVLNFSPVIQFNYLWDKRHNLRIDYKGRTTQPTTTQLSDVRDESNPSNVIYGNPNLKPTFTNNFRVRFQKFNIEKASALMVFGGFAFSTNDIVSNSVQFDNGTRETTYKNTNGNWNANTRVILNTPLRNKKFSVNSMSYISYKVDNSYVNNDKNISKYLNLVESVGLQFRSQLFDAGVRGNINYSNIKNNLNDNNNRNIYTYGGIADTRWYLPLNFTINTDLNYTANAGMTDGYDLSQWVWNASINKQIFKAKTGTISFNIYDILNQNKNISFSQSSNMLTQSMTNTLGRYFMVNFSYKFQIFKGGAKQSDMKPMGGSGFDGPGGRPPRM